MQDLTPVTVAQWERKRRGEDWEAARRNAVERGVPNGRAPLGYRKRPDGRLEVVEKNASKVQEAFRLRADGVRFAEIGRRFGWSHSTTRQILANVAYVGVARAGRYENPNAHPAIVTDARTTSPAAVGDLTRDRLLLGLARCAGCGRTLKVVHRKRADGSRVSSYFCKDASSEPCVDRAYVHAGDLDAFVAEWFETALASTPRMVDVVAAARELEQAQDEQAKAEAQLYAYVETADALEPSLFQRGLAAREKRVEAARTAVVEISGRVKRLPSGGTLGDLWASFSQADRREVLGGFLGRVVVRRGASSDLVPNVAIEWADGTLAYVADDEHCTWVQAA